MPKQQLETSTLFHALADSTRRAVLERLSLGPASVSELALPFEMALPSFVQHLKVLQDSGLVRSSKSGRVRTFTLEPQALQQAEGWLSAQRAVWERRLDQLDVFLLTEGENSKKEPNL